MARVSSLLSSAAPILSALLHTLIRTMQTALTLAAPSGPTGSLSGFGIVSWASRKQQHTADSSRYAEYIAIHSASHEVIFFRQFSEVLYIHILDANSVSAIIQHKNSSITMN